MHWREIMAAHSFEKPTWVLVTKRARPNIFVIGVSAVVTMQSMGLGATAYIAEAISGLGSNMIVQPILGR